MCVACDSIPKLLISSNVCVLTRVLLHFTHHIGRVSDNISFLLSNNKNLALCVSQLYCGWILPRDVPNQNFEYHKRGC